MKLFVWGTWETWQSVVKVEVGGPNGNTNEDSNLLEHDLEAVSTGKYGRIERPQWLHLQDEATLFLDYAHSKRRYLITNRHGKISQKTWAITEKSFRMSQYWGRLQYALTLVTWRKSAQDGIHHGNRSDNLKYLIRYLRSISLFAVRSDFLPFPLLILAALQFCSPL